MTLHQPTARNFSHSSENRIHSDDIARRFGFTGALVPGVAVFGHMTYPLTNELGTGWLAHSQLSLRLIKPAYHGDKLSVSLDQIDDQTYRVECRNATNVLLADVSVVLPPVLPPVDPRASIPGAAKAAEREEINWSAIDIDVPFAAVDWMPNEADNRTYAEQLSDDSPVYRAGVVHPHLIQHWCNAALVRRFILPAWIHVGTDMTFRRVLKVGDAVQIRAIPVEKWERKGHEFIKLYIAFMVDGAAAVGALHTAIYKVAAKER
jgi:acyl dehydratase